MATQKKFPKVIVVTRRPRSQSERAIVRRIRISGVISGRRIA